jgi:DNA-binding IscR family transcriptional regulator
MILSKNREYALSSLTYLGFANEMKRELERVSELAKNQQLAVKFTGRILQVLRIAGFVTSRRGTAWRGAPTTLK